MGTLTGIAAKLSFLRALRALRRDERGVTAMEYGLIGALVAVAIIAGVTTTGKSLNNMFNNVGSRISAAAP